jgi:DNA gyrase subunit A
MEKDTVDFVPNYDERLTEPTVFPAAFPNLLVNGGTGIAVGMATNIAPHNLGEIIDGICAQIDNPNITVGQLMKFVRGPDFPTGCMVCRAGADQAILRDRARRKIRGRVGVEQLKGGANRL